MSFRLACLAVTIAALLNVQASSSGNSTADQAGGDKKAQADSATCLKIEGALLERKPSGFVAVKQGDRIAPGTLVIGLPKAELLSADGKLKIELMLYLGETLPVTEAAVQVNTVDGVSGGKYTSVAIDRGIVGLRGAGEKGDTPVRIRSGKQTWELKLKEPDSQVLMARFGRHQPGTKLFQSGAKVELVDVPLEHLGILVVKGQVDVATGSQSFHLQAPPGPALMTWDSADGYEVKHLNALPEEVQKLQPADQKVYEQACEITAKLVSGDIGKGLDELVASDDLVKRRVAVACMGAVDDLPRLWSALDNSKHRDVREQAVLTLRNWMGRQPGHITALREHLTKVKKYNPVQARTITQLLKGFDEQDRKEPVIYQLLISALDNPALPIRELAYWNLERLAPAGQKIAYDAAATETARQKAVEQWRQLIPEGQLPPPPKKDEVKKGQ
jgi:hypothetical protein